MSSFSRIAATGLLILGTQTSAFAVYDGFVPTGSNVVHPYSSEPSLVWKQVGRCSASAVQISPRWILSAAHAPCSKGKTFIRADGARAQIDYDAPTAAFQGRDIHLSRLAQPLALENFAPLAFREEHHDDNYFLTMECRASHALIAGIGGGALTVGLSENYGGFDYSSETLQNSHRDLHLMIPALSVSPLSYESVASYPAHPSHPRAISGDSGGAVFLFSELAPNGALSRIIIGAADFGGSYHGFDGFVKDVIDSRLADPSLNPENNQLAWLSLDEILPAPSRPFRPSFYAHSTYIDNLGMPKLGDLIMTQPPLLQISIPAQRSCLNASLLDTSTIPGKYRLRFHNADDKSSWNPIVIDVNGAPYAKKAFVPDIPAGNWLMTVTALYPGMKESRAAKTVFFHKPANLPAGIQDISYQAYRVDNDGDGTFEELEVKVEIVRNDPSGENSGIYWIDYTLPNSKKILKVNSTFDIDSTGVGRWIDVLFLTSSNTHRELAGDGMINKLFHPNVRPGGVILLKARPYEGVALGPVRDLKIAIPDTL